MFNQTLPAEERDLDIKIKTIIIATYLASKPYIRTNTYLKRKFYNIIRLRCPAYSLIALKTKSSMPRIRPLENKVFFVYLANSSLTDGKMRGQMVGPDLIS